MSRASARAAPEQRGTGSKLTHRLGYLLTICVRSFSNPSKLLLQVHLELVRNTDWPETFRLVKVMREQFVSQRHTYGIWKRGRIFLSCHWILLSVHNCTCTQPCLQHDCPRQDRVYTQPYPYAHTQPCPNMTLPEHDCARTQLCPNITIHKHGCARTRLCPYTTLLVHNCAQTQMCSTIYRARTRPCTSKTMPLHDCVQT